jgi:hypothetical protein
VNDGILEAYIAEDDGLTIRDDRGSSLVVERWKGGRVTAWIALPGECDGPSVELSQADRERLVAYILGGAS